MGNPLLGVFLHWLGGLASGSFYVPYRAVKNWSWETYWLAGGFFSWIIAPWVLALVMTPDPLAILLEAPRSTLVWVYVFGAMWGLGGLTFGLTMRYLGLSLGMAVALGFCAVFGTLVPPLYDQVFVSKLVQTVSGRWNLVGIAVCVAGIAVAGFAGISKEKELPADQKKSAIKEFNFKKGLLVATFSGIMSACFSFGLAAGDPIKKIALAHKSGALWQGLPVLIVVLLGGFTTNCIWCVLLNVRNRTGYQYFSPVTREVEPTREESILETATDAPGEEMAKQLPARTGNGRVPLLSNWFFCAVAGVTWYLQFFFYSMGESQMGAYGFSSWTMHMASIIIFSTLWGLALKEWKGASSRTMGLLTASLGLLILSTIIIGYGNFLGVPTGH